MSNSSCISIQFKCNNHTLIHRKGLFCFYVGITTSHYLIDVLIRQVYILNTLTYLSNSDVFITEPYVFVDNNALITFLFYYSFTKKLSKRRCGNMRFMESLWTWYTCWCFLIMSCTMTTCQLVLCQLRKSLYLIHSRQVYFYQYHDTFSNLIIHFHVDV